MSLPRHPLARRYGCHRQIDKLLSGPVQRFSLGLIKHLHTEPQRSVVLGHHFHRFNQKLQDAVRWRALC